MELKEYQSRSLEMFSRWWEALNTTRTESEVAASALAKAPVENLQGILQDLKNYPKSAWKKMFPEGIPHIDRTAAAGFSIPHVCFKVPTGGGKTLLAAAALERLNQSTGLVLWMVPRDIIYRQTKKALWSREHPYRHMLERASGRRVKVLERNDRFNVQDVENYLCVMLISLQSANRPNSKETLKMFQDSGRYSSFFPRNDNYLGDSPSEKSIQTLIRPIKINRYSTALGTYSKCKRR